MMPLRTRTAALISLAIASGASAQVFGVIADDPRDGVPDRIHLGYAYTSIDPFAPLEWRFANEFDLPTLAPDGHRFAHLAFRAYRTNQFGAVVERFELVFYDADGVLTLDDFHQTGFATRTFEFPLTTSTLSVRVDVGAFVADLIASGRRRLGILVRQVPENASGEFLFAFTGNSMIETEASCPDYVADYDQSGGVDGDDIAAFFADWQEGKPCADVDQSAGVDGDDIEFFYVRWCCS